MIAVTLIEDDPQLRELFRLLIDNSPGFVCSHAFSDAEAALKAWSPNEADVVLMDIDLPGISGIACTQKLIAQHPQLDILMLTVHEDDAAVFDSLCAGASGYLLKGTPPNELLAAIEEVVAGGAPMSPSIARRVIGSFKRATKTPLTERETEVLKRLCDGENYRVIADALFVSTNTIKAHIKNIYRKLHVNSRAEAVRRAIDDRLV